MVSSKTTQPLGNNPLSGRNAVRGGGSGCCTRSTSSWGPQSHLHCFTGIVAHDPEYVQDRWRADLDGVSRLGSLPGGTCPLDFWRTFGCGGQHFHRPCPAV